MDKERITITPPNRWLGIVPHKHVAGQENVIPLDSKKDPMPNQKNQKA